MCLKAALPGRKETQNGSKRIKTDQNGSKRIKTALGTSHHHNAYSSLLGRPSGTDASQISSGSEGPARREIAAHVDELLAQAAGTREDVFAHRPGNISGMGKGGGRNATRPRPKPVRMPARDDKSERVCRRGLILCLWLFRVVGSQAMYIPPGCTPQQQWLPFLELSTRALRPTSHIHKSLHCSQVMAASSSARSGAATRFLRGSGVAMDGWCWAPAGRGNACKTKMGHSTPGRLGNLAAPHLLRRQNGSLQHHFYAWPA